jgi:hypothetical protein
MEPAQEVGHEAELLRRIVKSLVFDKLRDKHRALVEVRHRIIDRQPFGREVVPLEEPQDRSVALGAGPGPGRRERTSDPRSAIVPVDPKT